MEIKTSIEMQKNLIWLNLLNNVEDEDKLKQHKERRKEINKKAYNKRKQQQQQQS